MFILIVYAIVFYAFVFRLLGGNPYLFFPHHWDNNNSNNNDKNKKDKKGRK